MDEDHAKPTALEPVTEEQLADPSWMASELARIASNARTSESPLHEQQRIGTLQKAHEAAKMARKDRQGPIQDVLNSDDILAHHEDTLRAFRSALAQTRGVRREKKKRWYALIDEILAIQKRAKKEPDACMVYVGYDDKADEGFFKMSEVHRGLFDVWEDPDHPNSVSLVHPSTGKSTCLRYYIVWVIAQWVNVRIAVLGDSQDRIADWITSAKNIITSPRYQALFPHVQVLVSTNKSGEGRKNTATEFTVRRTRAGESMPEPTIRAVGIGSHIQGRRFDIMIYDDATPAEWRDKPELLQKMWREYIMVWSKRLDITGKQREIHIATLWTELALAESVRRKVEENGLTNWRIAVDEFSVYKQPDGTYRKIWPERFDDDYYRAWENEDPASFILQCMQKLDRKTTKIVSRLRRYIAEVPDEYRQLAEPKTVSRVQKLLSEMGKGEHWLSIDSAFASGKGACDTCVGRITIAPWNTAYLRQVWFMPGNAVELQRWIIERIVGKALFAARYVDEADSRDARHAKILAAEKSVMAAGDVDHVLIEGNAVQRGSAQSLEWNVMDGLRRMGISWSGGVHLSDVTGRSNVNASKAERLSMAALPLSHGHLKFPAVPRYRDNHAGDGETRSWRMEYLPDDNLVKLINQLMNAPHGKWDGADMISQFMKKHEHILQPEPDDIRVSGVDRHEDDFRRALRQQIEEMCNPKDTDDPLEEEDLWNGYADLWQVESSMVA